MTNYGRARIPGKVDALAGATDIAVRYDTEVLVDTPVGFWRLDEASGSALDASGGSKNGTYTGSPTLDSTGGPAGIPCRVFTGSPMKVDVAAPVVTAEQPVSIEVWVKYTGTALQVPIALTTSASPGPEVALVILGLSADGKVSGYRQAGTGTATYGTAMNDGLWHHIVVTINSANNLMTLYVDGASRATDSTPGDPNATSSNIQLLIGANYSGGGGQQYFSGRIARAAVYNTELSSGRVLAHYNAMAS